MLVALLSARLAAARPGSAERSGFDADDHNNGTALGSASCHPGGNRHGHRRWLGLMTMRAGASVVLCLAAPIELKTEGLTKGGQRPLGGVGLR
jgi:hypothetical protein